MGEELTFTECLLGEKHWAGHFYHFILTVTCPLALWGRFLEEGRKAQSLDYSASCLKEGVELGLKPQFLSGFLKPRISHCIVLFP